MKGPGPGAGWGDVSGRTGHGRLVKSRPPLSHFRDSIGLSGIHTAGKAPLSEFHRQVFLEAGGQSAEVDEALVPLFELLWGAGVRTAFSCQCHPPTGKVWISFASGRDAEQFLTAVVRGGPEEGWARVERWYFSAYDSTSRPLSPPLTPPRHPAGWEFHASVHDLGPPDAPNFAIHVDVLFPPEDLPRVIDRLGRRFGQT